MEAEGIPAVAVNIPVADDQEDKNAAGKKTGLLQPMTSNF
jgi:hypothetical protein